MKRKTISIVLAAVMLLTMGLATALPVGAATEAEIQNSIDEGLEWLVAQQNMDPLDPEYGSWMGYWSLEAGTGFALYKLCERARELDYESPFDPAYEYSGNVADGFAWLFDHLLIVPIGIQDHTAGATGTLDDPDTRVNGNGVMGTGGYESYHTGFMLTAIAASGTPGRINEGGLDVDGNGVVDTYQEIAQDMVDFLAFAQVDPSVDIWGNTKEGGWDYGPVDNGVGGTGWKGDQSNCGYVVLGLAEAEAFGCTVPDWVKTELNWWIDWVQDDLTGGSWYSYPNDTIGMNILKTGNLLLEMRFVGDAPDTPRVLDALAYLSSNWNNPVGWPPGNGWKSGNPDEASDYQTMFCIMKGLEYMGIPPDGISGVADWYMDFADAIIAEQDNATGGWLLPGMWEGSDEGVLNAEWALLTLELIAPPPPPTIRCRCPNFYFFAATEGGANPPSQTMTIYNFGDEGCAPLLWTVSDGADWLTLSPTSGIKMRTMPGDEVEVSVDISGMSAGRYFTYITVEAPGATNTPQQVPVILYIRADYGMFLWV